MPFTDPDMQATFDKHVKSTSHYDFPKATSGENNMTILSAVDSVEEASVSHNLPSADRSDWQHHIYELVYSFAPYCDHSDWDKNTIQYLFSGIIGCLDRKVAKIENESLPAKARYLQDLARANNGTEIDMTKFDDVAQQTAVLEQTAHDIAAFSQMWKSSLESITGIPYKPYTAPIDSSDAVTAYNKETVDAAVSRFSKYLPTS